MNAANDPAREPAKNGLPGPGFWQDTFDAIGDPLMILDRDLRIVQANAATASLLGLPRDQVLGQRCPPLMHGQECAVGNCPSLRAMISRKHEEFEFYDPARALWLWVSADPILDERGEVTGVVHAVKDITARRQIEEAIQTGQRRLAQLLETAAAGIIIFDANGIARQSNAAARRMLGFSEEEISDRPLTVTQWRLCREDGTALPLEEYLVSQVLARQRPVHGRVVGARHRGTNEMRWLLVSAVPVLDEQRRIVEVIVNFMDITSQRRATEAMRRSEEWFRLLAEHTEQVIWFAELNPYRVVYISPAYERLWGVPVEEAYRDARRWMAAIHTDDRPGVEQAHRRWLAGETAEYNVEYRIARPDGQVRWIEDRGTVIGTADGRPQRLSGIAKDITERKQTEQSVADQLRFERLLSGASARLGVVEPAQVSREIRRTLKQILGFLQVERCALLAVAPDQRSVRALEWVSTEGCAPGPARHVDLAPAFPWMHRHLVRRGQCLSIGQVEELPHTARVDLRACQAQGIQSVLAIPLSVSGQVRYIFATVALGRPRAGLEQYIPRLRLLGEVFVNAIELKNAEAQVRRSETFNRTVLASLRELVAIADASGTVLSVNAAWERCAPADRLTLTGCGVGANYLSICRQAAAAGDPGAAEALAGIQAVLAGTRPEFVLEYRCDTPQQRRWFEMVVQPLQRAEGGAVITHANVTSRRESELEAERLAHELSHLGRVATMGELTASLAHELNQPLTAILSNAQAAQRFLAVPTPDLQEIREILADIVADDQRAGEVIRRMRALLKKDALAPQRLDLNELVQEVAQLVRNEAIQRNVALTLEPAPALPLVSGDRVHLQQVLLNLITNAMDAVKQAPSSQRAVWVATRRTEGGEAQVSVRDDGPGIAPDLLERIFEPFFTTKADGMGMGLSICRSILRAHAGRIWAENNPAGGATVAFLLPAWTEDQA